MIKDKTAVKDEIQMVLTTEETVVKEALKPTGEVKLELRDANDVLKETITHNLVVNPGLSFITARMIGNSATVMSHMAIGSGEAAPAAVNTALGNQLGRSALGSQTRVTTNATNDAVQYQASFGPGVGTGAITEAGIFNSATAGDMLARTVFPVINKGAGDSLAITWKVTLS